MPESNSTPVVTETADARHTRLLAEAYGLGKTAARAEVVVVAGSQPVDGPALPVASHGSDHAYF